LVLLGVVAGHAAVWVAAGAGGALWEPAAAQVATISAALEAAVRVHQVTVLLLVVAGS
jgi:hypothetical protein